MRRRVQTIGAEILKVIYPPRCVSCGETVDRDFALCPTCWRDTPFISGAVCDFCGVSLPGEDDNTSLCCDDCLKYERPWRAGRAVFSYNSKGRSLSLALKHGDKSEIANAAGPWLARAIAPLLRDDMIIAPVPLHWTRLWKRRYNQSALLAQALSKQVAKPAILDLLQRTKRTPVQHGKPVDQRFSDVENAIVVHPRRASYLQGHSVLLVDDVMTSGATFTACTRALLDAGANDVFVLALARATKDH